MPMKHHRGMFEAGVTNGRRCSHAAAEQPATVVCDRGDKKVRAASSKAITFSMRTHFASHYIIHSLCFQTPFQAAINITNEISELEGFLASKGVGRGWDAGTFPSTVGRGNAPPPEIG